MIVFCCSFCGLLVPICKAQARETGSCSATDNFDCMHSDTRIDTSRRIKKQFSRTLHAWSAKRCTLAYQSNGQVHTGLYDRNTDSPSPDLQTSTHPHSHFPLPQDDSSDQRCAMLGCAKRRNGVHGAELYDDDDDVRQVGEESPSTAEYCRNRYAS